jgi:hypothetical protein
MTAFAAIGDVSREQGRENPEGSKVTGDRRRIRVVLSPRAQTDRLVSFGV